MLLNSVVFLLLWWKRVSSGYLELDDFPLPRAEIPWSSLDLVRLYRLDFFNPRLPASGQKSRTAEKRPLQSLGYRKRQSPYRRCRELHLIDAYDLRLWLLFLLHPGRLLLGLALVCYGSPEY